MKVVLIFGLAGACRCNELCNLTVNNIQNNGNIIIVSIPRTKTKMELVFTITDGKTRNLSLIRKYASLRPPHATHNRFFMRYRGTKCAKQPVGINTFSKIPQTIAKYLRLPNCELYTGHCFRRISASILVNQGGDILSLKRHGGWRYNTVAEGYIDDALSTKLSIADKILGQSDAAASNNCEASLDTELSEHATFAHFETESYSKLTNNVGQNCPVASVETTRNIKQSNNVPTGINFGGVSNCVINIYSSK